MYCKNCNKDNLPEAVFCENCGSKLEKEEIEKIESEDIQYCEECGTKANKNDTFCGNCGKSFKNDCPKCNSENLPESKFCSSCGQSLTAEVENVETKTVESRKESIPLTPKKSKSKQQKVKKGKRKKLLLIPLFIIVIIGALLFITNVKIVDSHKYVKCSICNGSTIIESTITCPTCKGRGKDRCTSNWKSYKGSNLVTILNGTAGDLDAHYYCRGGKYWSDYSGDYYYGEICSSCNGTGQVDCSNCSGYGSVTSEKDCNNCDSDGDVKIYIKITLADEWGW